MTDINDVNYIVEIMAPYFEERQLEWIPITLWIEHSSYRIRSCNEWNEFKLAFQKNKYYWCKNWSYSSFKEGLYSHRSILGLMSSGKAIDGFLIFQYSVEMNSCYVMDGCMRGASLREFLEKNGIEY